MVLKVVIDTNIYISAIFWNGKPREVIDLGRDGKTIVFTDSEDFIRDDAGREKLDGICTQLINIGEALKQIDKITDGGLLSLYYDVGWKKAKGMRDFITHHYFDVDHEVVFMVCKEHISGMTG